ncbi:hypothetical protein C5167_009723 [Papaver somniferum]|uniref:Phytocyanin domain-containing protein n=1 Tax=Papaver somniferum TaxID=3469 RepID=A0A4Y7JZP0_PAPSO|nr:hypothetical protein C5167_009723 [Papaver somniferum]
MGFNSKLLFSLVILVVAVPLMGNAFVWNVGDDAGWSGQSQFDYAHWAARPLFLVGDDSLRFVYHPNTNNVMEFAYSDFVSCNPTSPLATYNSGDDTVPITIDGHQYFISGNHVDCNNGLKLDILAYDSPYLRFWRLGGPPIGPDGCGKIPNFDNAPTEGGKRTEDILWCDSDSSTGGAAAASTPPSSASIFCSNSLLGVALAPVAHALGFAHQC